MFDQKNIPEVKIGLLAVSRDCFPIELSRRRRQAVAAACQKLNLPVVELEMIIENEKDGLKALEEIKQKGVNALAIYLGNFGPEGPTTIVAQKFAGPVMLAAAAEETGSDLYDGRGDAYCGVLNASYSIGLRQLKVHIPEYPVGTADGVARMIEEFVPIARAWLGLKISRFSLLDLVPRIFMPAMRRLNRSLISVWRLWKTPSLIFMIFI